MIYSDRDILASIFHREDGIRIDPFDEKSLQAASYDVHLANEFLVHKKTTKTHWVDERIEMDKLTAEDYLTLDPYAFVLGLTVEKIRIPLDVAGRLDGKSSIGRLGVTIHSTAGNIDPGNDLRITLEIFNQSPRPIALKVGMAIGQMVFQGLTSQTTRPYKGKYLNSTEVEASRIHLNFKRRCLHCANPEGSIYDDAMDGVCELSPTGKHVWR